MVRRARPDARVVFGGLESADEGSCCEKMARRRCRFSERKYDKVETILRREKVEDPDQWEVKESFEFMKMCARYESPLRV